MDAFGAGYTRNLLKKNPSAYAGQASVSSIGVNCVGPTVSVESSDIKIVANFQSMIFGLYTSSSYSVPNSSLLWPGGIAPSCSSSIVIRIDGTSYDLENPALAITSPMTAYGSGLGAYLEGTKEIDGITIQVHYEIVNNPKTGINPDTMKVVLKVCNTNSSSRKVGERLMFDTDVDNNDATKISLNNGLTAVSVNTMYTKAAATIPTTWWDYDLAPPAVPTLVGLGTLFNNVYDEPATEPDAVQIAYWDDVRFSGQWSSGLAGDSISDSAIVYWWTGTGNSSETGYDSNLGPGACVRRVTYYGLSQSPLLTTETATKTITLTRTGTKTPTCSVTQSLTYSPTITLTSTVSPTKTSSGTRTFSPTFTLTRTGTSTPTYSPTATPTNTITSTSTFTPSTTPTPSITKTFTFSPTITETFTNTQTFTFTSTYTVTPTSTRTATPSATSSRTPTPSSTVTSSRTASPSITPTRTATKTRTSTSSVTATPSITSTRTSTKTRTITSSATATPSITSTRTSTKTRTITSSVTRSPTQTPSRTITKTRTPTFTYTDTKTATSTRTSTRVGTASPTLSATPVRHPHLTVEKSASMLDELLPGQYVTYTIHFCNASGPDVAVAENVQLNDWLSDNTQFYSATTPTIHGTAIIPVLTPGLTPSYGGTVSWSGFYLNPGECFDVSVVVTVKTGLDKFSFKDFFENGLAANPEYAFYNPGELITQNAHWFCGLALTPGVTPVQYTISTPCHSPTPSSSQNGKAASVYTIENNPPYPGWQNASLHLVKDLDSVFKEKFVKLTFYVDSSTATSSEIHWGDLRLAINFNGVPGMALEGAGIVVPPIPVYPQVCTPYVLTMIYDSDKGIVRGWVNDVNDVGAGTILPAVESCASIPGLTYSSFYLRNWGQNLYFDDVEVGQAAGDKATLSASNGLPATACILGTIDPPRNAPVVGGDSSLVITASLANGMQSEGLVGAGEKASVCLGETIDLRVTLFNNGSDQLNDVVLSDELPQNLQWVSGNGATYDSHRNSLSWHFGKINSHESEEVNFKCRFVEPVAAKMVNRFQAKAIKVGGGPTEIAHGFHYLIPQCGGLPVVTPGELACASCATSSGLNDLKKRPDSILDSLVNLKGILALPNPSQGEFRIGFQIDQTAKIRLLVTDIQGGLVRSIELGERRSGINWVDLNMGDKASGMYFVVLEVGERGAARRMTKIALIH